MALWSRTSQHLRTEFLRARADFASQSDLRRHIGRGWIVLGSLLVVAMMAMMVAELLFDVPVYGQDGQRMSLGESLAFSLLIAGGGGFFILMGVLLLRWKPG